MELLSKLCLSLTPYTAGEQLNDKKYIKLNTNENPYPPAPEVFEAVKNFPCENLKLYPDFDSKELQELIAKRYGLSPKNVFVGNGSDEVLAIAFPTFFGKGEERVVFADITYSFYKVYCKLFNIDYEEIPLTENFEIRVEDYLDIKGKGAVIANPNAPTGIAINNFELEKIASKNPNKVIIIDEAYTAFAKTSAIELTKKYPNVLIIQTFSKSYSLAGIRCGYAIGNEKLIEGLEKTKNSFNSYTVNRITQSAAAAAFKATRYYDNVTNEVIAVREDIKGRLINLGFKVTESKSNFLFVSSDIIPAKTLYEKLREKGILIRYFNLPRIDNYVRISVGTKEQMERFMEEVNNLISVK